MNFFCVLICILNLYYLLYCVLMCSSVVNEFLLTFVICLGSWFLVLGSWLFALDQMNNLYPDSIIELNVST